MRSRLVLLPILLAATPLAAAPPAGVVVEHRPAARALPGPGAPPPAIVESRAPDGTVVTFLDGWGMERLELVDDGDARRMVCSGPDRRLLPAVDFRRRPGRAGDADAAR